MYAGVVLGGMGSIIGPFWGGMTIGLVQQLSTLVLPTQLQNTAIFVVFLLIVVFRAAGLLRPRRGEDLMMALLRSLTPVFIFAAVYAVDRARCCTNSYYQLMMTLVLVWACFGLSWNVLSGYTGLVSFGHAAFFGIGAYTTALGQIHFDLSPWLLIPLAAVLGGARRAADRPPDLPAARRLLRARDARLPAGAALRVRVARATRR